MAAALIYSLAPIKLNSTVLATSGLTVSPDIMASAFRHSGSVYPSVLTVAGAGPSFSFKTPFAEAYTLIGLSKTPLKCTTVEIYLAKFVDAARSNSNVHAKYSLASSALGFACITGASVDQNGVLMADVSVALISSDGMTHPLTRSDAGTLPTLSAEPVLYSYGPFSLNGTIISGSSSATMDMGVHSRSLATDGDLYPRNFAVLGYDRGLVTHFDDPATAWSTLGLLGANITANVVQYFRKYDATSQTKQTTGLSLTIASGRVIPEAMTADNLALAGSPARVIPLSTSDGTDPFVIASGVSIPTP
jgi:hypothetical protein